MLRLFYTRKETNIKSTNSMNETELNESFGTLSQTINGLMKLGYDHDFNIQEECLVCHQMNKTLSPEDFQIDKVYRFEGESNPDDQSILYAISSEKFAIKGTLVDGYGISSDATTAKLVKKLRTHDSIVTMEIKSNEATPQRPDGDRVLNASLVEMDLNQFITQLKSEKAWLEGDRNSVTIFKSDTMRIVLMGFHANAELKTHKANGVISVQVVEGEMTFSTADHSSHMQQGHMIALQANILHSVMALKDTFFLLTLSMNQK